MHLKHGPSRPVMAQAPHATRGIVGEVATLDGVVEDPRQQRQALVDRLV